MVERPAVDPACLPGQVQATFRPGPVPADGQLVLWGTADPAADAVALGFPAAELAPTTLPTVVRRTPRAYRRLAPADVPAVAVDVEPALRVLAGLDAPEDLPAWAPRPSDAVVAWSTASLLALELVAAGRIVPAVAAVAEDGGATRAHWRLAVAGDERWARLAAAMPPAAHALRRDDGWLWAPGTLLAAFGDAVADALADREVLAPLTAVPGAPAAVAAWTEPIAGAPRTAAARLCLRLDPPPVPEPAPEDDPEDDPGAPPDPEAPPDPDATWHVAFLLQAADDPSLLVPADEVWDHPDAALALGARRLGDVQEALVTDLARAARVFARWTPCSTRRAPPASTSTPARPRTCSGRPATGWPRPASGCSCPPS